MKSGDNMSLKGGLSDTEIRNAIADNKLHEYVDKGIISKEKYNILLEIYGSGPRTSKEKEDRELSERIKGALSSVILFVSMLCGLVYIIEQYGKGSGVWYIFLWIWAVSYAISN